MKKTLSKLLNITLIGFFLLSSTFTVQAIQNEGSAWVLVNVIDNDSAEEIATANETSESYRLEGSYNRNNYSLTSTYIGPTDDYYDPPIIQGESLSFTASFSEPPQVIYPDQEIPINISLSAIDNHSYFNPFASVRAQIGKNDQSYWDFTNGDGKGSFRSDIKNNYASINEKVTAIVPGGAEGDTLEIRFYLYFGVKLETWYVYEWQVVGSTDTEIEQPTPMIEKPTPEPYSEDLPENCKDSGIRFSDLAGEVLVRPHDDILAWDMAELDMVLCVMDHVKTSYDSFAILGLRDMTTFLLKPESEVILNTLPKESKISLLAGKIWVNVKKMIKDGEMNIEMSQAIAGIKGTTLVLEENGSTSTLKVLNGTVEFTSYAGESTLVSEGQMVSVTSGVFSPVTTFSVEEELEVWGASSSDDGSFAIEGEIYADDAVTQENSSGIGIGLIVLLLGCAFLGFLIVAAVVIVFLVAKKKGKAN